MGHLAGWQALYGDCQESSKGRQLLLGGRIRNATEEENNTIVGYESVRGAATAAQLPVRRKSIRVSTKGLLRCSPVLLAKKLAVHSMLTVLLALIVPWVVGLGLGVASSPILAFVVAGVQFAASAYLARQNTGHRCSEEAGQRSIDRLRNLFIPDRSPIRAVFLLVNQFNEVRACTENIRFPTLPARFCEVQSL